MDAPAEGSHRFEVDTDQGVVRTDHVVIATGRSITGTVPIIEMLGLTEGYVVCSNGAVTAQIDRSEPHGYRLLDSITFDPRPVLDRLGDILRQLFVLRREGGETIGALPESAAATTALLLHMKLENARAAWLAGEVADFVRILTSAHVWLARHFALDQPAVSAFEAEIQRLQRQQEVAELPDLTRSLTLLRAQLEPGAQ